MNALIEGHTYKRYDGELSHLHYLVLEMGGMVLGQLRDALAAFKGRDIELAHKVMGRDGDVDRLEVIADEEITKLLARRCPVGSDLRLVIAVSKSVSDLECVGDEAARIARMVTQIFGPDNRDPNQQFTREIERIGSMAQLSLQYAVEIFDVWDKGKAGQVSEIHWEMDQEFQAELRRLMTYILEDSRNIGIAISIVLLAKSLERITHHSQNLAEHAIFMMKGLDLRSSES